MGAVDVIAITTVSDLSPRVKGTSSANLARGDAAVGVSSGVSSIDQTCS